MVKRQLEKKLIIHSIIEYAQEVSINKKQDVLEILVHLREE